MIEWEIPVPPSEILAGPSFSVLPGRRCSLVFYIEDSNFEPKKIEIIFDEVHVFTCTYKYFLTTDMIEIAYGKVVSLEDSPQLKKMSTNKNVNHLKHYIIVFDFGPCYEIISENFCVNCCNKSE